MAKVADVKLSWKKSPSLDISSQVIEIKKGSAEATRIEVGPEVESYMLEVDALNTVSFTIQTLDIEGQVVTSDVYSFSLGDLEVPLPATDLFHEVIAVRDLEIVVDPPVDPVDPSAEPAE